MGRPIRIEFPGATYHVMSRGVDQRPTFQDDLDRELFLDKLGELVRRGWLIVYEYCLMLNHFHMLCRTPLGRLSRWMQQLLGQHSRRFNRRHQRSGHLWQHRYKSILVQDGDYFLHCSRYISLNPAKAGLVTKPEDYAWSSYAACMGSAPMRDWVSHDKILGCFETSSHHRRFVLEGLGREIIDPLVSADGGIAFGDQNFVRRVRLLLRKPAWPDDTQGFRELHNAHGADPGVVEQAIEKLFSDFSCCQKRRILIYCLRRFTLLSGRDIARLTDRTPSAVSHVWRTIEQKTREDHAFNHRLTLLERQLMQPDL
jgi:putative transposase